MFWTLKLNFCNLFISKHYITKIFVWFSRRASCQQKLIWSLFKSNLQLLHGLFPKVKKKRKLGSWQSASQQVMRAIPVNLNSTLVSLNSSLVSLNSTQISLSIVSLCGLRLGYIFIGLGISFLYGIYVSWNMRAIPVNLHKNPGRLNSTPVSLENTLPVA